jgi:dTDP-4-amino-4,6-dideoxygalactose transaminase
VAVTPLANADILAAFLYAQLESRDDIQAQRRQVWEYYAEHLLTWAETHGVGLPVIPGHNTQPFHMFYLLMPSLEQRQALIRHLRASGILSVFHYQPLHLSPMGRRYGYEKGDCPVAEDISARLLRLPFYSDLETKDLESIVEAVCSFM